MLTQAKEVGTAKETPTMETNEWKRAKATHFQSEISRSKLNVISRNTNRMAMIKWREEPGARRPSTCVFA